MSVKIKASDIAAQWGRYELAKAAALRAETEFAAACDSGRPAEECRALWEKVGEAVRTLESEWEAYRRIAPARIHTKKKEAA